MNRKMSNAVQRDAMRGFLLALVVLALQLYLAASVSTALRNKGELFR